MPERPTLTVKPDPEKEQEKKIKARQKTRQETGKPAQVKNDDLWQLGMDIMDTLECIKRQLDKQSLAQ